MDVKHKIFMVVIILVALSTTVLLAADNTTCKPYTEKEMNSIRVSNNANLVMGVGVVAPLINPQAQSAGKELLRLASRIESPKGVATVSFIEYQIDFGASLNDIRENIMQLLQDDKENALPYYLNALLLHDEEQGQEALAQIKKGNAKVFNGYPRERFHSVTKAAEMARCSDIQARRYASWSFSNEAIYRKLRHLCQKISEGNGLEARTACYVMGQNLERGSLTCLEKVNSLNIQINALDASASNDAARKEIKNKRAQALACGERTEDISESELTEEADKQYYEIFFKSGEAVAQRFLSDFIKQKHQEDGK